MFKVEVVAVVVVEVGWGNDNQIGLFVDGGFDKKCTSLCAP